MYSVEPCGWEEQHMDGDIQSNITYWASSHELVIANGPKIDPAQIVATFGGNPAAPSMNEATVDIDQLVCFGTVPSIAGRCSQQSLTGHTFPAIIESSDYFRSSENPQVRGPILPEHGQMIQGLLQELSLELFAFCALDADFLSQGQKSTFCQVPCLLEITIYGPLELFEQIGSWFQDYDVYLQDPKECHHNVRYCNPQRLSSDDLDSCPMLSEIVSKPSRDIHFQEVLERPELLDIISGQEDLEEAIQPALIQSNLHKHQKQALTFMLRRERGWALNDKDVDIWQAHDSSYARTFINRITEANQIDAPPQFFGGIIADPMGLGKTLTMIALTATDIESVRTGGSWNLQEDGIPYVSTTLIIVPQPLLNTWEDQITEHVVDSGLSCRRHHGKFRLSDINEITSVNVVLTTYHTLSADWKASRANDRPIMFSVRWKRIILDEAHLIRNMKTRMARAICELESISRWAVTGTPVQNQLSDLTALLKFIRAYPYDDPKRFDADISKLWKCGKDEEAVKRLKRLSSCLILRRAKNTVDLPPRHDKRCPVDFKKSEKALYDTIRDQTITKIDEALFHGSELSTSGAFVNFLQQIESMRLICNLGLYYHNRHDKPPSQETSDWVKSAQETFNIRRSMESVICSQCSSTLDIIEPFLDDNASQESPLFSRCLKYSCPDCTQKLRLHAQKMGCGHTPRCPIAPVSLSFSAVEDAFNYMSDKLKTRHHYDGLPSKVEVLISDLKSQPIHIKSIVFSTWRLTLNIIETGLAQAGIKSVRFDGKVSQSQRQVIINQFKSDPEVRVMLLTLQCGAVGLTLTEASRAYLMEPHWNPTIEEQALARIHRIGQTQEVTTIRFYIRDSFEERVIQAQESKKNLAGVLLSGHDGGHADDSIGALQRLRSLL